MRNKMMQEKKQYYWELMCFIYLLGMLALPFTGLAAGNSDEKKSVEIYAEVKDFRGHNICKDEQLTIPSRTLNKDDRIDNISGFAGNVEKNLRSEIGSIRVSYIVMRLTGKVSEGKTKTEYTSLGRLNEEGKLTADNIYLSFVFEINDAITFTEEGKLRILFYDNAKNILEYLMGQGTYMKFKVTNKKGSIFSYTIAHLSGGIEEKEADFMIGDPVTLSLDMDFDDNVYPFVNPYALFKNDKGILARGTVKPAGEINATITINCGSIDLSKYSAANEFAKKFPITCNFPILSNLDEIKLIGSSEVTLKFPSPDNNDRKKGHIWVSLKNKEEFVKFIDSDKSHQNKLSATFILSNNEEIPGNLTFKISGKKIENGYNIYIYIIIAAVFLGIVGFVIILRYKKHKPEGKKVGDTNGHAEFINTLKDYLKVNKKTFEGLIEESIKSIPIF